MGRKVLTSIDALDCDSQSPFGSCTCGKKPAALGAQQMCRSPDTMQLRSLEPDTAPDARLTMPRQATSLASCNGRAYTWLKPNTRAVFAMFAERLGISNAFQRYVEVAVTLPSGLFWIVRVGSGPDQFRCFRSQACFI